MRTTLLMALLASMALPATAERNLVPSLISRPDVCADRPSEPEWMQNLPPRDAYKRVLVQDIYRAQNLAHIVDTRSCACDIRFPSWDAAEALFEANYANAERWEMLDASDTYNRRASTLRPDAMTICQADGNW